MNTAVTYWQPLPAFELGGGSLLGGLRLRPLGEGRWDTFNDVSLMASSLKIVFSSSASVGQDKLEQGMLKGDVSLYR